MKILTCLAASILLCSLAQAASQTTTFQVSASVNSQCNVTATNLAFGLVDPIGGNVDSSSTISVKCTKNSPYTIGLSAGTTPGATISSRLMNNNGVTMLYNLYTDAARTIVWGDSAVAPFWVSGVGGGMGTAQIVPVYGRVPGNQTDLVVGNYLETAITVTVTY